MWCPTLNFGLKNKLMSTKIKLNLFIVVYEIYDIIDNINGKIRKNYY